MTNKIDSFIVQREAYIVLNHTVEPYVSDYIIKDRNPKFGKSMYLGLAKCRGPFLGLLIP